MVLPGRVSEAVECRDGGKKQDRDVREAFRRWHLARLPPSAAIAHTNLVLKEGRLGLKITAS